MLRITCSVIGMTYADTLVLSRAMNTNMTGVAVCGLTQDRPTAVSAVKDRSVIRDAPVALNELYLSGVTNDTMTT